MSNLEISLKKETVALYLFQQGTLPFQEKILRWLEDDQGRKVYLIAQEVSPSLLIEHPRVKVGIRFHPYVWEHLFQPWEALGGESKELAEWILGTELSFSLYQDFGLLPLSNVFNNLCSQEEVKQGEGLAKKFSGIPAVICGAGPSLTEQLEALKKLGEEALIIGSGSALAPLSKAEVPLHFAAALDPDPPPERFRDQSYFETPLFYQNQVSPTLLSDHPGPRICFGRSEGFPLEEWLTEESALSSFEAGWNVSTFATQIAIALGCNPIYFVGVDLCVYEDASYAAGVEGTDTRENPIELEGQEGETVATRPDFLMSRHYLEQLAKEHPEVRFVHVNSRGLCLDGIPTGSLPLPRRGGNLHARVQQQLIETPSIDFSSAQEKLQELDRSLSQTQEILEKCLMTSMEKKPTVLHECALEEEIFFRAHLIPLWKVWKNVLQTEEVVSQMEDPSLEKKVQEILFYKDVTEQFCHDGAFRKALS